MQMQMKEKSINDIPNNNNRIIEMGQFLEIDSTDLVPGDIYVLENKSLVPCDTAIVSGELLLNEASLTGETIPIPKI